MVNCAKKLSLLYIGTHVSSYFFRTHKYSDEKCLLYNALGNPYMFSYDTRHYFTYGNSYVFGL